jgi:DNA-binding MarR family transcriptional regulator
MFRFLDVNHPRDLLFAVIHVAGMIQDRLEAALAPTGLSLAKLGALRHLAEANEPLPLGQLAERIACVKSNVTQLVDRLEADQLVRRVPDPSDRRSVRAEITDEGRSRYEAGMQALEAAEDEVISELGPEDQDQLHRLLDRLVAVPLT